MRISTGLALLGLLWPWVSLGNQFIASEPLVLDGSLVERWPARVATVSQSRTLTRPTVSAIDELIVEIAESHEVDKGLVRAVVQVESTFNPAAVSSRGASGLMQLMPQTAEQYGVRNILDPGENIQGGVQHLKYLLKVFKNDTTLALAAYNAGVGAVRKYRGVPPYKETRAYVRKVLDLQRRYSSET